MIFLFLKTPAAAKPVEASLREKFLQMDFIGTITIMAATICYLLAMEWGGITKPWSSGSVITILAIFGVLVTLFVLNEWWQGDRAQIAFTVLAQRTLAVVCLFTFL